jgi:micrococcal nuclease
MLAIAVAALSAPAAAMPLCSGPDRVTCVVDGDTVWIEGEKIRLADLDTPEPSGACEEERVLAARSAGRLAALLAPGDFVIRRGDPVDGRLQDRFGRTLAVILVDGVSVATILIGEGLARPWAGRRESWC